LTTGGSENLLVNHVRQLQRAEPGIKNHVCVLGSRSAAANEYLQGLSLPVRFLDLPSDYRRPKAMVRYVRAIRSVISELQPDIVHSYLWTSDVFCAAATFGLDIGRVAHVLDRRGDRNASRFTNGLRVRATGFLLRQRGTVLIAVSDACRNHAITQYQADPNDVITIHNGIEADSFAPVDVPILSRRPIRIGT